MKKTLIVLVLLLALLLVPMGVMAQAGQTWQSGVQVVNLGTAAADIVLTYYNPDGTIAATVQDAVSTSKTYFPLAGVSAGFNGSMVIASNQPVTAIANLSNSDFSLGASTTSFEAGSTKVSLPLVMCNNSNFNTFFSVQNAGGVDANITINYIKGSHGVNGSEMATIKPGASKVFDQTTGSSTLNCSTLGGTDGKFIGGATITSNEPIVATLMQVNTLQFKTLLGYNGFTDGASTLNLPLVMANNSSFYTGIQIQNTGASATTVTITYAPNTVANGFQPSNETCVLDPGASCTKIQNSGQWINRYIGAATVTSSNAQPLVAIVNQTRPLVSGLGPFGSSYEGFNPTMASETIVAPLVVARNGSTTGYFNTGIQVMNVGAASCPSVTIDYAPNTVVGSVFNPVDDVFSLAAGASATYIQDAGQWTSRYIGSAEIKAPGCSIVAIVNYLSLGSGDRLYTYTGYNK